MLNIIVKDLEMSIALDKRAMINIIGSGACGCGTTCTPRSAWSPVGTEIKGRTECVGTFLVTNTNGTQELKQRYRCYYIRMAESYEECDMSFTTSVCCSPC